MGSLHPYSAKGRSCRIGDYSAATGAVAARGRELGTRSAVGCSIVVRGRIWRVLGPRGTQPRRCRSRLRGPLPTSRTGPRPPATPSAAGSGALAEQQAALRRVASLVAEGTSSSAVLDAGAAEMEGLLQADRVFAELLRAGRRDHLRRPSRRVRGAGAAPQPGQPRGRECDAGGAAHRAAGPRRASRGHARCNSRDGRRAACASASGGRSWSTGGSGA
jgi:hypothetical protein